MRVLNRKGDTPTILLFVVTIVLVLAALFYFATFKGGFAEASESVSGVLNDVAFYQNYLIKQSEIMGKQSLEGLRTIVEDGFVGPVLPLSEEELRKKFKEIAERKNLNIMGVENFYVKVRDWNGVSFKFEDGGYVFEMKNLLIYSIDGGNKIRRTFSFIVEFDDVGKVVKSYKI